MQNLSRRSFGKSMVGAAGLTLVSGGALLTEGCSSQQVINEINVVLQQIAGVLAQVEPNAPWAQELRNAISALLSAEQQWQAGGAVQVVVDVLNTIVAITAVIPITAPYSPLIDILVAGIEAILAALPQSTKAERTASSLGNPHVGRTVIKHRLLHSYASDCRTQWNAQALALGMPTAVIA